MFDPGESLQKRLHKRLAEMTHVECDEFLAGRPLTLWQKRALVCMTHCAGIGHGELSFRFHSGKAVRFDYNPREDIPLDE